MNTRYLQIFPTMHPCLFKTGVQHLNVILQPEDYISSTFSCLILPSWAGSLTAEAFYLTA